MLLWNLEVITLVRKLKKAVTLAFSGEGDWLGPGGQRRKGDVMLPTLHKYQVKLELCDISIYVIKIYPKSQWLKILLQYILNSK